MNRFPANDPREWLNRARSNLIQAQAVSAGVYLEDLCFQAHQAAEKALKAFCLFRRLRVPRTHNLIELAELLTLNGVAMTDAMRNVIRLNPYAVGARYPGTDEPVDVNEPPPTL